MGWVKGLACLHASALVLATMVLVAPASSGAAQPRPQVVLSESVASPGQSIQVNGRNFPPNTDVQAQVCGNNALNGSADCVLSTSQEVATTKSGLFQVPVLVTIPSKPCPCVVLVLDFSSSITPTAPLAIVGAKYATPSASKLAKLQVENAYLEGSGPWTAWFGASPQRTLVLTVHNPNPAAYVRPPLVLAVGNSSDTTTHEATLTNLASLGPYQTKTYLVHVTFPALSIGEHQVVGVVGDAGLSKTFIVKSWLFPWGLLVVALLVLELILLAITAHFRERRRRREAEEGPPGGEAGEDPVTPPEGMAPVGVAVGAEMSPGDRPEGVTVWPPPVL